jgi:nanoRNase/pAp phosphatase (c-di-AMP/oligoRNAs hydrolase)
VTYVFVCADEFLARVVPPAHAPGRGAVYVVETAAARDRVARRGGRAVAGDLATETVYRRVLRSGHEAVLVIVPRERRGGVLSAIRAVAPAAPLLLVVEEDGTGPTLPGVTTMPLGAFTERVIEPELERAMTRARVDRLRAHFAGAERVVIMMQDDPDPDAIASALALRAVLGRTKTGAPLASFGTITRPENRAMIRILEIEVERLQPRALATYDRVAMVDVQPSFFEEHLPEVDLVIDHHPEETPVRARLKDIRPSYGATSTILTEYLRAAEVKITQRLATALLYGIKSDTLALERGAIKADMDAFAFLHPHANHSALRRIERPELPNEALDVFALGIARRQIVNGVVFSHVGTVGYAELVPQFADFLLQVEGVEWSVASGVVNGELHISVRNVGYVRDAGEVVRQAFGDVGSAGGHRSMAKAVIKLRDWRSRVGEYTSEALRAAIVSRFSRALR